MSSPYPHSLDKLGEEQLLRWQRLLEQKAGICFSRHQSIIKKGINERMKELGIEDYESYYQRIESTPLAAVEWDRLLDHIVVKETSFFREPYSYELAEQYILEIIKKASGESSSLDIWSVGCSTGEEAYSLAMLADNLINNSKKEIYLGITGLDISEQALQHARNGVYKKSQLDKTANALTKKYFTELDDTQVKIKPALTDKMCFTRGNIIELNSAPKMKMDLIFCQNVLIYFRRERQLDVMNILIERLKPNGLLVIGPGEIGSFQHSDVTRSVASNVQAYVKNQ